MSDDLAKLIAERDQAWKRAGHAEKMWGEAEVKLAKANDRIKELEAIRMMNITEKEYELFQKLKTIFKHAKAEQLEGVYFICGEGGEKDALGLPEFISVCPAFGLDGFCYYKKHTEYSAPGW